LALPSIEKQAIENKPAQVDTWKYKVHNSIMYVPEGMSENINFLSMSSLASYAYLPTYD